MARNLLAMARDKMMAGSTTPFADVCAEMDDADLCAMDMKAKDFFADSLYHETRGVIKRGLPFLIAATVVALAAVVAILLNYTWVSLGFSAISGIIIWRRPKPDDPVPAAEGLARVVAMMKYENEVAKAMIEGLRNIRDKQE